MMDMPDEQQEDWRNSILLNPAKAMAKIGDAMRESFSEKDQRIKELETENAKLKDELELLKSKNK